MAIDATFRAGGLASGLDTNGIVDQLVALEQRPLDLLRARQSGLKTQVSSLGDLISRLETLRTASTALGMGGALAYKVAQSPSRVSVTPGTGAVAGRYSVQVDQLAAAGKARSAAFSSGDAAVTGGTLHLTVMGQNHDVPIADGMALGDVAAAINASDAPVSAAVLFDGQSHYLSLTNRETGHPVGGTPAEGLSISQTVTGTQGQALALAVIAPPANAKVTVDGLTFERRSNTVADVLPGLTMELKATGASEDLVVADDPEATAGRLQKFVDAYNDLAKALARQLAVSDGTNRDASLAGDSSLRSLQGRLQSLLTRANEDATGTVRALADLGIQTQRDGSLKVDAATLQKAVERDPRGVEALFSGSASGLGAATRELVDGYTSATDGVLTQRRKNLSRRVDELNDEASRIELRVQQFKQNLLRQFAAMEQAVSGINAIGNFLTQQDKQSSKKG